MCEQEHAASQRHDDVEHDSDRGEDATLGGSGRARTAAYASVRTDASRRCATALFVDRAHEGPNEELLGTRVPTRAVAGDGRGSEWARWREARRRRARWRQGAAVMRAAARGVAAEGRGGDGRGGDGRLTRNFRNGLNTLHNTYVRYSCIVRVYCITAYPTARRAALKRARARPRISLLFICFHAVCLGPRHTRTGRP